MTVQFLRLFAWLVLIIGCCFSSIIANDVIGINDFANPTDDGAPRIISSPVLTGVVGQAYYYDVNATGEQPMSYKLVQFPPDGMTINYYTGEIYWVPAQSGIFSITVMALNTYGSYLQQFTISVTPTPAVPYIYSNPPASVLIGESFFYDVNSLGYPLPIYKLTQFPLGMTIEAANGRINWDPQETGSFDISVLVENSEGSDTQDFILNVYEFPVIISEPDTTATMNNLYQYDVEATGSPAPAYTLTEFPSGMTINNATGLIEWTPDSAGHVNIMIQVGNPAGVVVQEYILRIESVYESPSIFSQPVTDGTVGQLYTYDVEASGSPVPTFSLTLFPGGMIIDPTTGVISWTPTTDGDFDIWVQADNLAGSITQIFTITVEKADAVPAIESTPILEAISGEVYTYNVIASGFPTPEFSLVTFPAGMNIDQISGLIQWTPLTAGDFAVSVAASNTWGTDLQDFTIHSESPASPFITSLPVTAVGAGQTYSYDVEATGFPIPTYSLDLSPAGMTIDAVTGQIIWYPTVPDNYDMTIRAINSVGSFTQSFVIAVVETFQAPAIITTPDTTAEIGVTYIYDANASGYPIPTFILLDSPAGMTVEASTGLVEWTPSSGGSWTVELQAINSVGNAIQSFVISTACCGTFTSGQTGNTNCDEGGLRDLADITRLIDNVYISKTDLCCTGNGNVNGDGAGLIDLADITKLIDHVYITKLPTETCN